MTAIHPSNRRFFAKWAAWYWLRSVPNIAMLWLWKHHGNTHTTDRRKSMAKEYTMTLEEYEAYLTEQMAEFFRYWRERQDWPRAYSGKETLEPCRKWEDQFRAWQDRAYTKEGL